MWKKTAATLGGLLGLMVFIFSCTKPTVEGKSSKVVTIDFMNAESSLSGLNLFRELISEFEQNNPDIKIKFTPVPSAYETKLLTQFGGGTPPDVFLVWTASLVTFMKKGILMNLDQRIKESKVINIEDFFHAALFNFYYDQGENIPGQGSLYGLPKDFSIGALAYNKDLFDEAGLSYPDKNWGWKEFLDAAQKLTVRDSSGPYKQIGISHMIPPFTIVVQLGGDIWSQDYKRCLLDSEEGIRAYQICYDVVEKYHVAPRTTEIGGWAQEGWDYLSFKTGKAGMNYLHRSQIPDFARDIGNRFRWGVAPIPSIGGKYFQEISFFVGWAIGADTKHPDEAWRFMEYLCSREAYIRSAELGWGIPPTKEVAYSEHFVYHSPSLLHPEGVNKVFLEPFEDEAKFYYRTLNPYIRMGELGQIFNIELNYEKISKEGGKVDNAMRRAVKSLNAVIEEHVKEF